jgi:hypothetical protein
LAPTKSSLKSELIQRATVEPYSLLRQQAADRRDRIINAARDEYRRAVQEIDALQRGLDGKPLTEKIASRNPSIVKLIYSLMPKERAFTLSDIAGAVRQAHPAAKFRTLTLRYFLQQMEKTRIVIKIGRNDYGLTLWAASGVQGAECPRGQLVMIKLAEDILQECGPLASVTLAEKIQERGYRPNSDPRRLVGWLRRAMTKYPGRIVQEESGHWVLVQ